jgi:uncharacterized membrane protein YfcA
MNALAGGGSFVTLPTLIAIGLPSVAANASSTVALYPGGAASAWVYRNHALEVCGVSLRTMLTITLLGGLAGALLLLWTPSSLFDGLLPWLLLVATLMLAAGPRLGAILRSRASASRASVITAQGLLGVYGGYFGGAVGLMMVAAWTLLSSADIKAMAGPRTLLVCAANTIAVLCFIVAHAVYWPQTLLLAAGALLGGYGGAHLGKRLPVRVVRIVTVSIAAVMTVLFFVRAYR